jgi:hypothetical protein
MWISFWGAGHPLPLLEPFWDTGSQFCRIISVCALNSVAKPAILVFFYITTYEKIRVFRLQLLGISWWSFASDWFISLCNNPSVPPERIENPD